jgi:RimJ/RimL family protein N-acetyltransferase
VVIHTHSSGEIRISQLEISDSKNLFEFYYEGLSVRSRELFFPYPLFDTPVDSVNGLAERISKWKNENTWSFLNIYKDDTIIGVSFLKRIDTEFPTSGLAVSDKFHKRGFGMILQQLVIEQAKLLGITRLYVKVDPENEASRLLHERCGYQYWRMTNHFGFKNGIKTPKSVIEMTLDITPRYTSNETNVHS